MSLTKWVEPLLCSFAAGTQLSNTTTATSIVAAGDIITLNNNFWYPGKTIRITGMMEVSNVVTTPGTLTLDFRLSGVVAFNGAAMQMSTTAHTTLPLHFQAILTCRTQGSGTAANLMGIMVCNSQVLSISGADTTTSHTTLVAPNVTPVVGTGFDSSAALQLDMFAKFSVATNPTNCKLHMLIVEALN